MSTPNTHKPFRREIELDFIRGIAILLVMDYHDGDYGLLNYPLHPFHIPNPGWMGVNIFFVLSGFLVGGLLVKEWKVKGRINSKSFLIRRGFKIWPQYYFFLFLLIVTGHRTLRELWGNLLNIQNYVGGVAHTWSLAVEEHAYLLIALILALAARWNVRMRTLFFLLAGLSAAVLIGQFELQRPLDTFVYTHMRVNAIFYGVMLAILYHYRPDLFHRMQRWWWLWLSFPVMLLLFVRLHLRVWWEPRVGWDLGDLCGISLLMLLYHHTEGRRRNWLYRAVAWVGLYSYGIYLWHVSVERPVAAVQRHLPAWLAPEWAGLAPIALGIIIGVATTKLVELPALRLRDKWFPRPVDSPVGTPAEFEPLETEMKPAPSA